MHFNGRFVVNLAEFSSHLGGDRKSLLGLTGLSYEELCQEKCHLGPEIYNAVVESAVQQTGDELLGLHAGENLNLQAAGLIVQIAHSSSTVREALEYCCEFANLGCSALPTQLLEAKDHFKMTLIPNPIWEKQSPLSVAQTIYGYLSFTIREFQSLIGNKRYPKEIRLTFAPPSNMKELERVLGCPVKFHQKENAIIFRKTDVHQAVKTSDYALLQVLVKHAQEKVMELQSGKGFYEIVKRSIVNLVKPEFPTIEQVAGHLNMSVRTFQRKLKAEGYSYRQLIEELREDFAKRYLSQPELSVSEIAYLLDYGSPSAFVRSFKRWTGQTPNVFRSGN